MSVSRDVAQGANFRKVLPRNRIAIMSAATRTAQLSDFAKWAKKHLQGDEKGEAQLFLERLFRAFGWPGLKEAGATLELRIKNDSGGTSFADLVWKPTVLIEMKKK